MAFALEFPSSEELIDSVPFPALKSSRWFSYPSHFAFPFAVTKEAAYLVTRKKGFVVREPFETTRVPLATIREVSLEPARVLTVSAVFWLILTVLQARPAITDLAREVGWQVDLAWLALFILGPIGYFASPALLDCCRCHRRRSTSNPARNK